MSLQIYQSTRNENRKRIIRLITGTLILLERVYKEGLSSLQSYKNGFELILQRIGIHFQDLAS